MFVERSRLFSNSQPTQDEEVKANVVKLPVQVLAPYNLASPVEQSKINDFTMEGAKKDGPNEGTEELKHCWLDVAVTVDKPRQV